MDLDNNKEQLPENEAGQTESIALQETESKTESKIVEQGQEIVAINNFLETYAMLSQLALIEKLKEVMNKPITEIEKDEVDAIRQLFYKKHKAEIETQKKAFVEDGGEEADFESKIDENEVILKELLQKYRD